MVSPATVYPNGDLVIAVPHENLLTLMLLVRFKWVKILKAFIRINCSCYGNK